MPQGYVAVFQGCSPVPCPSLLPGRTGGPGPKQIVLQLPPAVPLLRSRALLGDPAPRSCHGHPESPVWENEDLDEPSQLPLAESSWAGCPAQCLLSPLLLLVPFAPCPMAQNLSCPLLFAPFFLFSLLFSAGICLWKMICLMGRLCSF